MKFFHHTDGVAPEVVIKIAFPQYVIGPMIFVKPLLPWKNGPMDHVGQDLCDGHQQLQVSQLASPTS